MPKNKGRYSKDKTDLVVEDEFISTAGKVAEKVEPHAKQVLIGVGAVLAIIAVVSVFFWHRDNQAAAATAVYAEAARLTFAPVGTLMDMKGPAGTDEKRKLSFKTDAERFQAALAELEKLKREYGNTKVWQDAKPLYAATLYDLGRYADAIALYKEILGAHPDTQVAEQAQEGLGYAVEAQALAADASARQKGLEEALAMFTALGALGKADEEGKNPTAMLSLYHRGRVLAALGKNAEAKAAFEEVLAKDPDGTLRPLIEGRVALLRARRQPNPTKKPEGKAGAAAPTEAAPPSEPPLPGQESPPEGVKPPADAPPATEAAPPAQP